jgi:hypothetical protein
MVELLQAIICVSGGTLSLIMFLIALDISRTPPHIYNQRRTDMLYKRKFFKLLNNIPS